MARRRQDPASQAAAPQPPRTIDQFLWDAGTLATAETGGDTDAVDAVKQGLEQTGVALDSSQWAAWRWTLTHRLSLIWGPPGTGKTKTLAAILSGACLEAARGQRPIRILVSAFTYTAIDNVLERFSEWAAKSPIAGSIRVVRLRAQSANTNPTLPGMCADVVTEPDDAAFRELKRRLSSPHDILVVGSTSEQVYNLVTERDDKRTPIAELFDFIAIDEGSQLDVGHSIPLVCAAAGDARILVAGDPMQLAPIAATSAPVGAEVMLGSIYVYLKDRFALENLQQLLEINYRSNDAIVEYGRVLCYPARYRSRSPNLKIRLHSPLPSGSAEPAGWPQNLPWSPAWSGLLDPEVPVVCFHYDEGRSGQSNNFEAQAVASLSWLLSRALSPGLGNETGRTCGPAAAFGFDDFWQRGVGIVTPHTAQRALITATLQRAFGASVAESRVIRDAVDTVEKFQGGERYVILASFAVGDPDVVGQEEEFLLELNRFNVMASRARAKLVVLLSDQILDHLASDLEVLEKSRAIKQFVQEFCRDPRPTDLPWLDQTGCLQQADGVLRTRS